jgi:hypothetical protein
MAVSGSRLRTAVNMRRVLSERRRRFPQVLRGRRIDVGDRTLDLVEHVSSIRLGEERRAPPDPRSQRMLHQSDTAYTTDCSSVGDMCNEVIGDSG